MASILQRMAAERNKGGQRENTDVTYGNVAIELTSVDKKAEGYGWLLGGKIISGLKGIGEEIFFVIPKENLEKYVLGTSLAPKVKVGGQLRVQNIECKKGQGTANKPAVARRITGLNLDQTKFKTHLNAGIRLNVWKNSIDVQVADLDKAVVIDSIATLREAVMSMMGERTSCLVTGAFGAMPMAAEAFLDRIKGENNEYTVGEPEVAWDRFVENFFAGEDIKDPEVEAALDAELAELAAADEGKNAFRAYPLRSLPVIGKTNESLVEKIDAGARPNSIPLDEMFLQSIGDRFNAAFSRISDKQMETMKAEFTAWATEHMSGEEIEAFTTGGWSQVSDRHLSQFLIHLGFKLERRGPGQVNSWTQARERLENNAGRGRNRVRGPSRSGWILGDYATGNEISGEKVDFDYLTTILNYGKRPTPYFPNSAMETANNNFLYGISNQLQEFLNDPEAWKAKVAMERLAAAQKAAEAAGEPIPDSLPETKKGAKADPEVDPEASSKEAEGVEAIDMNKVSEALDASVAGLNLDGVGIDEDFDLDK